MASDRNPRLIEQVIRLRSELAARRRRAREFASIEAFSDHFLRDIGYRRDGIALNRHLARF